MANDPELGLGLLAQWKLFDNEPPKTMTTEQKKKALERALETLNKSDFQFKDEAADALIGLHGMEEKMSKQKLEPGDVLRRRHFHLTLVRMQLPPAVLEALRGR